MIINRVFPGAILGVLILAGNVNAAISCSGVPQATKVGEYGNQEMYLIVKIKAMDYRLGLVTDDSAKSRFSLASTALVYRKKLLLKFFLEPNCASASTNKTIPDSVQLLAK